MRTLAVLAHDTTGYRLLLLAHILCVIIGFGSTFVYPVLGAEAKKRQGVAGAAISDASERTGKIITSPFIWASGFFGLMLVLAGHYDFDAFWIQAAITLFLVAMAFSYLVHLPNLKRLNDLAQEMAAGPPPAQGSGPPPQVTEMETRVKAAARNGGFLHLLFAVLLILMIWKPS